MSAAVTEAAAPETDSSGELTAEELAEARRADAAGRARWAAAGVMLPVPAPASQPRPIASEDVDVDDPLAAPEDKFGDLLRDPTKWLERIRLRDEEHRRQCTAIWCDCCGRHACRACRRVAVAASGDTCRSCEVLEALRRAGVPPRYLAADLEDDAVISARIKSRGALALARQTAAAELGGVVLTGPIGRGKTTLAAALVRSRITRAIDAGQRTGRIIWTSAIALERARAEHRLGSGDEAELVGRAIHAALLVIDDLGAEAPRGADVIAQIIHARHDADVPTWATVGLSSAEVGTRYSGGVERRLYEGATIIDCSERSAVRR